MSRVLSMMLIACVCFLSACKSDEEKARELGFKDLAEQQYAQSKGFQTKKQLTNFYAEEENKRNILREKFKNSVYCFTKLAKFNKLIMYSSLNGIEKGMICNANLGLFYTHIFHADELRKDLNLSDDDFRTVSNPISEKVQYEIESLAQNGTFDFRSARSWSEASCSMEISMRAEEKVRYSRDCNPDNLESPFR